MYQNILNLQRAEYNKLYQFVNKKMPSLSKDSKKTCCLEHMLTERVPELKGNKLASILIFQDMSNIANHQYILEVLGLYVDMLGEITRYYIKDESLFDFFKQTEVKPKEICHVLDELNNGEICWWGILGKTQSYALSYTNPSSGPYKGKHFLTLLSDKMNYTFCIEDLDKDKNKDMSSYNLAMNFLFYCKAFPECVLDGVPPSEKKNTNAKVIGTSPKVVHHTTTEHGFITPHFRSGHFRHLDSDYYKNKKVQIIFVAATMVKGRAKTVLTKDGVA